MKWAWILLLLPGFAMADSIPFTGTTMIYDNWLDSNATTTNRGSDTTLYVGASVTGKLERTIIQFPGATDSVSGRTVDSAFIYMSLKTKSGFTWTNDSLHIWAVIPSWNEVTSNWLYRIGGGEPIGWTTTGCRGASSDYHDTLLDAIDLVPVAVNDTIKFDVTDAYTNGWTNYGYVINKNTTTSSEYLVFRSSEGDPACWHTIYYTPAATGNPQIIGMTDD